MSTLFELLNVLLQHGHLDILGQNKRLKLTWYRYFLFIFFFTLKISSNFWLCKACHIYNFLKCYSGIKSTKHYCTHPVDMAKTSIQLLLWLSFCVMSSLHFTGSICELLRIRNLRQSDIVCCAFLLCKFPWEIKNGLIKFFSGDLMEIVSPG